MLLIVGSVEKHKVYRVKPKEKARKLDAGFVGGVEEFRALGFDVVKVDVCELIG